VLHDLTGAPAITIFPDAKVYDHLWDEINNGEEHNFVMTAGTTGDDDKMETEGLVEGHAYSLLEAHEIEHHGHPVRLVKMRNPWGQKEWSGKWSDNDAVWNEVP